MPSRAGPQNSAVTDSTFDKEIQTLLASWPMPARQLSSMTVFMRSMMITELENLGTSGDGRKLSPPMQMLVDALQGLQAGQDNPIFQPARINRSNRGRGRPPASAQRTAAVRFGVRYRLSAEQGIIEDCKPKETIGKVFGVNRRTVERWFKEHRNKVEPLSGVSDQLAQQLLILAGAVYDNTLKKLSS